MSWGKTKSEEELLSEVIDIWNKTSDIVEGFIKNVKKGNMNSAKDSFVYLKIECKEMYQLLSMVIKQKKDQFNQGITTSDINALHNGVRIIKDIPWSEVNTARLTKHIERFWRDMLYPKQRIQAKLRTKVPA